MLVAIPWKPRSFLGHHDIGFGGGSFLDRRFRWAGAMGADPRALRARQRVNQKTARALCPPLVWCPSVIVTRAATQCTTLQLPARSGVTQRDSCASKRAAIGSVQRKLIVCRCILLLLIRRRHRIPRVGVVGWLRHQCRGKDKRARWPRPRGRQQTSLVSNEQSWAQLRGKLNLGSQER